MGFVAPLVGGIASGVGGLFSGKNGSGSGIPKTTVPGIASTASNLGTTGTSGYTGASNYWNSLLQGGNAAQQAVAPYAESIAQQYQGAKQNIQNNLPQGGEKNLALAQLPVQQAGQVARLYAGVQPTAAQNLGGLGLGGLGVASNLDQGLLNYSNETQNRKGSGFGSIGSGLGSIAGGKSGSGNGGGKSGSGGGKGGGGDPSLGPGY